MGNRLTSLLDELRQYIPNPRVGLPEDIFYFISQMTPLINVELLIKNKTGQTLLTWRHDQFYGPAWHIPGGIIRFKETVGSRILKVADAELGCLVRWDPKPLYVHECVNKDRDVRGHFISFLYLCELATDPDQSKQFIQGAPMQGNWAWHDRTPSNFLSVHEPFRVWIDEAAPLHI